MPTKAPHSPPPNHSGCRVPTTNRLPPAKVQGVQGCDPTGRCTRWNMEPSPAAIKLRTNHGDETPHHLHGAEPLRPKAMLWCCPGPTDREPTPSGRWQRSPPSAAKTTPQGRPIAQVCGRLEQNGSRRGGQHGQRLHDHAPGQAQHAEQHWPQCHPQATTHAAIGPAGSWHCQQAPKSDSPGILPLRLAGFDSERPRAANQT